MSLAFFTSAVISSSSTALIPCLEERASRQEKAGQAACKKRLSEELAGLALRVKRKASGTTVNNMKIWAQGEVDRAFSTRVQALDQT